MRNTDVVPPWTVSLTDGEHALIEYGIAVAAFCLAAMLTRMWSARREVGDRYRPAVHASVAVCTVAFLSYLLLAFEMHSGYRRSGDLWVPTGTAMGTWTARYMDWTVSVPLLVVEVVAVSAVVGRAAMRAKVLGGAAAVAMVTLGFLGAVVVGNGADFGALLGLGIASSVCFVIVYAVVIGVVLKSLPVLPAAARGPMVSAMVVLLVVWFVYPIAYGLQGVASSGALTVTEHLLMSGADIVAKVLFGLLLLRVARIRTAADVLAADDVHPESIWIDQLRHSEGASRPVRSTP
ncbi:bacteriorhodopsin [Amnibacterium kyonggiense]|uniref:Bacteriorhodopsin n=1 Tax=Amnibacterium kyonggiense TaxID=595671 RepID=A0A4R7FLM5_9MICO|nr:bacteriorhodopsin [Amnibacterium kyonggiense]TDS77315.1 bacteriorhodopsin [Amnibacterium kyonggiense]